MDEGILGREYCDCEVICCEGQPGDRMYIVQSGRARVFTGEGDSRVDIGDLRKGDVFGEMSIFDKQPRSASVEAVGTTRILTLDKRAFLRRVHEDPTLAFTILQKMSERVRALDEEVSRLKRAGPG